MRLRALSESPDVFLGKFDDESGFQRNDWLKTFSAASWHGYFMGDEIVGIAKSAILMQYPDERYVESFWVDPDHRNHKVGREILQSIIAEAEKEKRAVIRLSVLRKNRPAIEIFRHLGFSVDAGRSNHDEICLQLAISGQRELAYTDSVPAE